MTAPNPRPARRSAALRRRLAREVQRLREDGLEVTTLSDPYLAPLLRHLPPSVRQVLWGRGAGEEES